jgi:hypothetical protein
VAIYVASLEHLPSSLKVLISIRDVVITGSHLQDALDRGRISPVFIENTYRSLRASRIETETAESWLCLHLLLQT